MDIRRYASVLCVLVAAGGVAACGSSNSGSGSGGQSGTGGVGGGGGGAGGGAVTCPGTVVTPAMDCPTTEIVAPSGTFPNGGVCGEVGRASAVACSYDGTEELVVWGEDGQGDPITSRVCVIRFNVRRVGNAPPGCEKCLWTQTLEYSNPTTMVDVNGACANSGYGLNTDKIARLNGCRVAVGYEPDCLDHNGACRWKYRVSSGMWVNVSGIAYCSAAAAAAGDCSPANDVQYENRAGCTYR